MATEGESLRLRHRRAILGGVTLAVALSLPLADAGAFGTPDIPANLPFGPQNREHERMTRAALACPPGTPSDGTCFEPLSIDQLAGKKRTNGGVGAPDFPPPDKWYTHCDDADYVNAGLYPGVATYPVTRADASKRLRRCRKELVTRFKQGLRAAPALLDAAGRIKPGDVDITPSCTFLGGFSGAAKCNVFDGFGRSLHGVQDFYSHSNWSDGRVPRHLVTTANPPGLARRTITPFLDLRQTSAPAIPNELSTGCFSLFEKNLRRSDGCIVGGRRSKSRAGKIIGGVRRVVHANLQKDAGMIDPATGAATAPQTRRGKVGTNFANAVRLTIADTQRQWSDLRSELVRLNGPRNGNLMICALTRDDPVRDCQGRKLAIVVDSSGSNTSTDPSNLRIAAAMRFNQNLISQAEAGPGGVPDRSAVVDFDSSASVISPLADPDAASFGGIDSSGGTNIASGVDAAVAELTKDPADPTANRSGIVILTDGQDSDRAALIAAIGRATGLGIRISEGFLRPPANPVPASASEFQVDDAPPDLVAAILASGGFFGVIDSAESQAAFVSVVEARGATALDDPDGPGDGGRLADGVGVTALAENGRTDTFAFEASRGRVLDVSVASLSGQPLRARVRDVRTGKLVGRGSASGTTPAEIRARPRRASSLEVHVIGGGAGGPYEVSVAEQGVDLPGTRRRNTLRCGDVPTFVDARGGNDLVTCGSGDDMIVGGRGRDTLRGRDGDDIFQIRNSDLHRGTERINGGAGTDLVEFSGRLRAGSTRCVPGRQVAFRQGAARWVIQNVERITFAGRPC